MFVRAESRTKPRLHENDLEMKVTCLTAVSNGVSKKLTL